MKKFHRVEVSKVDPYDPLTLWDENKRFDIQNMLLRQVNFPAYIHPQATEKGCTDEGDLIWDIWSNRIYVGLDLAASVMNILSWHTWIHRCSPEDFLKYIRYVIAPTYNHNHDGEKVDWRAMATRQRGIWYVGALVDDESVLPPMPTGARIVRFTSKYSGAPVHRFDVFFKGTKSPETKLYSDENAPNVVKKELAFHKDQFWSIRGRFDGYCD